MGISVAAASVFWMFLFHPSIGFFNKILVQLGLDKIGWLTDPEWALISVALSTHLDEYWFYLFNFTLWVAVH